MKKLIVILTLLFAFQTYVPAQTKDVYACKWLVNIPKTDSGKKFIKAVDNTLQDTAAVAQGKEIVTDIIEQKEESGLSWFEYLKQYWWVFLIALYKIAGIVASHYPTYKNLWWLRLDIEFIRKVLIPKSRAKEGGFHE